MLTGFLSVVHESNENVKFFLMDFLNFDCVCKLEMINEMSKNTLLIVTLIALRPNVVLPRIHFDVDIFNCNSKPWPSVLQIFLREPKICSRGRSPYIFSLLSSLVPLLIKKCCHDVLTHFFPVSSVL